MEIKKRSHQNPIVAVLAVFIMLAAFTLCFLMIRSINRRMNESATSNLLNTTRVIENTLEHFIDQDFDSLGIIGELYKSGASLPTGQMATMRRAMGFERICIVDAQGRGVNLFEDGFQAAGLPCCGEWVPGEKGYADAYFGASGRLQTTMWLPVYQGERYIGTVFGDVVLSKYYSADVFTFYEGEGRTYLFDGTGGAWILRSLGTDGASRRQEDIYALLLSSGNPPASVDAFRQAVESKRAGTAVFQFNGKPSYICFLPLASSEDWYLATVIPNDVLLKESSQVQQMIQLTLVLLCAALLLFTISFAVWQIRRTRAQEAAYREALFLNVSSNIDSAFLIYETARKKTVFVSENVGRLLNLNRDELQSDARRLFDWCRIPLDDPQAAAFLDGSLDAPAVRELCVEDLLGANARYLRLELIPADAGQEIAVLTDITKDKDIQQSLLDAMQRAEAASHAKNNFLSAMSHDIRTPMNGIVGMTAIAAAHLDDRDRVRDCLGKISDASAHLLTIINEVLDMSQIESGKLTLAHDPFNVAQVLQDVLSLSYPGIQQKHHTLKVHIHSMAHEQVLGDAPRLQRVTANLLSNAIKYTPDGGQITLELREKPPLLKGYGRYELTVRDNGIGMSSAFQEKLFQPFEREEDVRTSRIQGTGLGMSIVKNIVTLMLGEIQVESEKHKGTTFRVTVNLQLDETDEHACAALSRLPVLVVDDDRATCEAVAAMLCDLGMDGEWVDNGVHAVERAAERHRRRADFMAILLDWKMPGMDGIETARRIRQEVGAGTPLIVLTAYDWSAIETQARSAGVDAFLSKPIYKAKLRHKLSELASAPSRPPFPSTNASGRLVPAGRRILLVEDNQLNLEIAAELLRMMDLRVDAAVDGIDAVERFAAAAPGTYDLILMDIQMPRMNGYQATKHIRAMDRPDSRTIPIVAMTADAFAKDVQAAYAAGMNEHLAKPISVDRLVQVLAMFLPAPEKTELQEEASSDESIC